MMPEIAKQRELLTRLVEESYDCRKAALQSISPYTFEDRGIYRVDWEDGTSYVLRAFSADVTVPLTNHAAVLDYLQPRAFPAPQVKRTSNGGLLASYAGWTALLVSFIEGKVSDFAPHHLELLANSAGRLHMLSRNVLAEATYAHLPASRLRPTQPAALAIDNLNQALPHVPDELHQFCEDCIGALQRIQQAWQAGLLPETLIHGDCWPANAVQTDIREMALIDWDCAGIGPAILDVGYLLLACHLGKPQLPTMQADEQCIASVVHGYCQQRKLSNSELSMLEDAVLYDVARRTGQAQLLSRLPDDWKEEILLQKMLARHLVSSKIARIARHYFEQAISTDDAQ